MGMFTKTMITDGYLQSKAAYLWLVIEQLVFMSTLMSNIVFLLIRSHVRHKLQLDAIDEKNQLPNVDTIIAISEVANAFHAQFVPWLTNTALMVIPTGEQGFL